MVVLFDLVSQLAAPLVIELQVITVMKHLISEEVCLLILLSCRLRRRWLHFFSGLGFGFTIEMKLVKLVNTALEFVFSTFSNLSIQRLFIRRTFSFLHRWQWIIGVIILVLLAMGT